jgi:hypothetical protein
MSLVICRWVDLPLTSHSSQLHILWHADHDHFVSPSATASPTPDTFSTYSCQILSQLTTRLRLYGANCNATSMVLQAIKDTKIDMTIWPAICEWLPKSLSFHSVDRSMSHIKADQRDASALIADIDSNETANAAQVKAVEDSLKTYGTDHVEGVSHAIPCSKAIFTVCSQYPVSQESERALRSLTFLLRSPMEV